VCRLSNVPKNAEDFSRGILHLGAELGFFVPDGPEISEARELAERAMGCEVATDEAFANARRLQPGAVLVARQAGRLSAVVATLLLREEARAKLIGGLFCGRSPDPRDLSQASETPALYYIWGVAGDTQAARGRAAVLCRRLRYEVLPSLAAFMTSATADGRRAAIGRLQCEPASASKADLLVSLPIDGRATP
jgi:hypothetical protein